MYYGMSILVGASVALMVTLNGNLAAVIGNYPATVTVHLVGLITSVFLLAFKDKKRGKITKVPLPFLMSGVIGIGTTLFNNLAFGKISVSAILALSLLGETAELLMQNCHPELEWPEVLSVIFLLA